MFDITLTREALTQVEASQTMNRYLAKLLTDIAEGRGYVIMCGNTTVSVIARQQGERKIIKAIPAPVLEVHRYTQADAAKRVAALNDPSLYRVERLRSALKQQGDALSAYHGELFKFLEDGCGSVGMCTPV